MDDWAASKGFPELSSFATAITSITEDGAKFLDNPEKPMSKELLAGATAQRAILRIVATTTFGRHIGIPSDVDGVCENHVNTYFAAISEISWQLAYCIKKAACADGELTSHLPDIIDSESSLGFNHPLKGFIILRQAFIKLNQDPQGTTLQMKDKLINEIRNKNLNLWGLVTFMDWVNTQISHIVQRQTSLKQSLEMEAVSAMSNLALKACRSCVDDKHAADDAHTAALHIQSQLITQRSELSSVSWLDFQLRTAHLISSHLPSNATCMPCTTPKMTSPVALYSHMDARALERTAAMIANWTCEHCGLKGHKGKDCSNPPNPDAAALVEAAKAERSKKRKERFEKRTARDRLTKARTGPPPAAIADAPPEARITAGKQIHASLSVLTNATGSTPTYRSACMAIVHKKSDSIPSVVTTALIVFGCVLGSLLCAMTTDARVVPQYIATGLLTIAISALLLTMLTTQQIMTKASQSNLSTLIPIVWIILLQFAQGSDAYVLPARTPFGAHGGTNPFDEGCTRSLFKHARYALTAAKSFIHDSENTVWIDSGCTKTVFRHPGKLQNLQPPDDDYFINGVGGVIRATQMGDFHIALQDPQGRTHVRVIKDCLLAPDAPSNLLSTHDLRAAGIGFEVPSTTSVPATINITTETGERISFPLKEHHGLFMLPFYRSFMTEFAGLVSHQLRALTESEVWHRRLCHASAHKIAKLSENCVGIKHCIAEHSHPCHVCHEAKATKQDLPPASDHSEDEDTLCADSVDFGTETLQKNRYMTIFVVLKTRYVMIFLHKSKNEFPALLRKALAQLGRSPKILRADGAGENCSDEVDAICLEHSMQQQHSNPHEQFGNAPPETMVNNITQSVRVSLHDANLPIKYWGYAAINAVDVYNHLPHSALGMKSPWECEKGTPPDVSWFRPFGCRATVYIGEHPERLWHHKLAARGEPCVYLGLGLSHGLKGWVCWNPEIDRIYCTRNVVFDETFMPLRAFDQRVLGHYDSTPRRRLAAAAHGSIEQAEQAADDIDNMITSRVFEPIEAVSDTELDDTARLPAGRLGHDEADDSIVDLADTDK